jgi:transposase
MIRTTFSTHLLREDFETIRIFLDSARKTTRPKIHDTYDVFCAVLFVLSNEAPWRSLPDCFPPWRSVHHHFVQWTSSEESETMLEQALYKLGLHEVASRVRDRIGVRPFGLK